MRYDFDRVIDRRNTNCHKWDLNDKLFGTEDVLDMWVADMDFSCPEPVLEALRRRLDHPILGYTFPPDSLYEAIVDRMERRYGWRVEREWVTFTPGVVTGIYAAIQALVRPGDEIVIQPPVYPPFFGAVTNNGCQIVTNRLLLEDGPEPGSRGGRYVMDFEDLARRFETTPGPFGKALRIRALVLCSPHNPVGRVWTRDELQQLADICLANDCVIISDEIHCDLLLGGATHIPTASLSPEIADRTITLMAPSKTFNLAGLEASFAIIPNPDLRDRFERARVGRSGVNALGLVAMEVALRDCDDYLDQLNAYLTRNIRYFAEAVAGMRGVSLVPPEGPEGTYLAWVDMRELGPELREGAAPGASLDDLLKDFMLKEARIAPSFGSDFGPGGEGFERINLACPRSVVEEAVSRLSNAVSRLQTTYRGRTP